MTDFSGKRILITGATSGIGLAGARRLSAEGAQLILTGTDPERLAALEAELSTALVVADDASDPQTGAHLAEVVAGAGPLDGLWLNAGYADVAPPEDVDAAAFDRMMSTNVRGPVLQLAALSPHLRPGASVVATSSTATYEGAGVVSLYAATKGALVSLVRCWAAALGERSIRVNALVPGPIDTRFRDFMSEDTKAAFEAEVLSRTDLGRSGSPEEAAAVGVFLLSDESSFVTGSQYAVDGGLTKV